MQTYQWYKQLKKPKWAPPSWLFGPAWTVLYILIAISFGYIFLNTIKGNIPILICLPFILNLLFNLAFTPIQFGLRNNILASIDILLVLGTIIWILIIMFSSISWIVYMLIPYFLWVSFATVLQLTITWMNRKK